jgi:glycerol uptake facilitator-like aquaporin
MGKKLIAEFLGTFCLVFAGTGSIVIGVTGGAVSFVLEMLLTALLLRQCSPGRYVARR